jgi:hypothetical protein
MWDSGGLHLGTETGHTHIPQDVGTANRWGIRITDSLIDLWWNDSGNGTDALGGGYTYADVHRNHHCLGVSGTQQYPTSLVSFKVWQAPILLPPGGGGTIFRRH